MSQETSHFEQQAHALGAFLNQHLPLARAAGVVIDHYDGQHLQVSAPLELNINDKLTAFGGSLYNLCVIAAWGVADLKAKDLNLEGDIVVAKGEINYHRPLRSRLVATAFCPNQAMLDKALHSYQTRGKAVFSIQVEVRDQAQNLCVTFEGKYAVLKPAEGGDIV